MKIKKKLGGGGGVRGVGLGGQGGCERRIEVFVKIKFKKKNWGGGGGGGGSGGQGGCDRRIEVFGENSQKNIYLFFWGVGGWVWGSGWWGEG